MRLIAASKQASKQASKRTFEGRFYSVRQLKSGGTSIYGFPQIKGNWCTSDLKTAAIRRAKADIREYVLSNTKAKAKQQIGARKDKRVPGNSACEMVCKTESQSNKFLESSIAQGADINIVQYLGIAADEHIRIERHQGKKNIKLPLVEAGWTEQMCYEWCKKNDLLSPIYTTSMRGGCWFCHNQNMQQLRLLRKNYPDLWALLMKWDLDSPVTFHADGHTVHDIDRRIAYEERGLVPVDRTFRWDMVDNLRILGCEEL